MNTIKRQSGGRIREPGRKGWILGLAMAAAAAGCGDLLDVENPNQLVQADLESPAAAGALANGAVATVTHALGWMTLVHGSASDELQFVGSRNAWIQLEEGNLHDPANEFTDQAWPSVTRGRWMADEAVRLLKEFDDDGLLVNRNLLARSQLYSAVIYTAIADMWDDFPLGSNRMEAGPPIGRASMSQLYDQAITNLTEALAIAQATGNTDLQAEILAQRARTRHARAVWTLVAPGQAAPANPWVNDAQAVADALAALDMVDNSWRFRVTYSAGTVANEWGFWVNERLELRVSDPYVFPEPTEGKTVESIRLEDPIDEIPDRALEAVVMEAVGARQFNPVTVVSAKELHLILAEAGLAGGTPDFTTHINAVRALNNLTPFAGQMDEGDLLRHMRRVNLFKTGRRLMDHYRFGEPSYSWVSGSRALTTPGTLFPITEVERRSNCHILGTC
jgi:starch-binding outer membrane protein, SusD/RagB family